MGQTYDAGTTGIYTVKVISGGCVSAASAGVSVTVYNCPPIGCPDPQERISNGIFPTTPAGNTNTIPDWTVGGTASGNRIQISSKGIRFFKDGSATTTLTQPLTNVSDGAVIQLKNAYWTRTGQNNATAHSTFTVAYAGVVYATFDISGTNPTITGQNGALALPGSMPAVATTYTDSTPIDINIYLPSALPLAGNLVLTLIAGSSVTEARDFGLSAISLKSCEYYCVKPGDFSSGGTFTKVGITIQKKLMGWPESVPNGFIALESKTKGFVITRVQNSGAIPVTEAKEGMLIYDIDADCVKLYNGNKWKCIARSCNE